MEPHSRWFIAATFLAGLLLAVAPLAHNWQWFRPAFISLLVIFWVTRMPTVFGVGFAWLAGLIQDLVTGAAIGSHALSLAAIAYLCLLFYRRMRAYSAGQQVLLVFVLVGIQQLVSVWVHEFAGKPAQGLVFLWPAATSALLWPVVSGLLHRYFTQLQVR
ncbi:rod shape-determining protein MreD [Biformimicrobium ophioploci]|uniref:Rod shape-determining protein MreD n=1 Tax=Biformimicrobium ophioploci TaxID=3036711 RepID=A0ABQ6LWY6_9GAMM|nr:rod shape-determining protein MreD [Microbulbifer sp. NKW57]GMG86588.1 rod shape-determining protein MreD [Microbulbifer sp. NKW57]